MILVHQLLYATRPNLIQVVPPFLEESNPVFIMKKMKSVLLAIS